MLNIEKVRIVQNLFKRERETTDCVYPTDEEVIAGAEVFYALIDLANMFHLEMLSAWAVLRFQHFNGLAFARNIQDKIQFWTKLDREKKESENIPSNGVSASWVLSQLAGMHFENEYGRDAYDYLKEHFVAQGFIKKA